MRPRRPWTRRIRRTTRRPPSSGTPTGGAPRLREEDVVWIMGSPRTGSPWLLDVLGGLTDGARIDEPLIAPLLATPATVIPGRADPAELLHDVARSRPEYFFADAHAETWGPLLSELLLRSLATSVPPACDGGLVLVNEPHGAAGAPVLLRAMPHARLLVLQRDGRDVVDSMVDGLDGGWGADRQGIAMEQHGSRDALIRSSARGWVRDTEAVARAYAAHDPRRRIQVRYEDLQARPVDELARLLDWLARPVDRMRIREVVDNLDVDRITEVERGRDRFPRAVRPGLWREHFDDAEQRVLDDVLGPTLARLGYTGADARRP